MECPSQLGLLIYASTVSEGILYECTDLKCQAFAIKPREHEATLNQLQ